MHINFQEKTKCAPFKYGSMHKQKLREFCAYMHLSFHYHGQSIFTCTNTDIYNYKLMWVNLLVATQRHIQVDSIMDEVFVDALTQAFVTTFSWECKPAGQIHRWQAHQHICCKHACPRVLTNDCTDMQMKHIQVFLCLCMHINTSCKHMSIYVYEHKHSSIDIIIPKMTFERPYLSNAGLFLSIIWSKINSRISRSLWTFFTKSLSWYTERCISENILPKNCYKITWFQKLVGYAHMRTHGCACTNHTHNRACGTVEGFH